MQELKDTSKNSTADICTKIADKYYLDYVNYNLSYYNNLPPTKKRLSLVL